MKSVIWRARQKLCRINLHSWYYADCDLPGVGVIPRRSCTVCFRDEVKPIGMWIEANEYFATLPPNQEVNLQEDFEIFAAKWRNMEI